MTHDTTKKVHVFKRISESTNTSIGKMFGWIFVGLVVGYMTVLLMQGLVDNAYGVKWTPFAWFLLPIALIAVVLFFYAHAVREAEENEEEHTELGSIEDLGIQHHSA